MRTLKWISVASAKEKKNIYTIYALVYNAKTFLYIESVKLPDQFTYTNANTPSQNITFPLTMSTL